MTKHRSYRVITIHEVTTPMTDQIRDVHCQYKVGSVDCDIDTA